MVEQRHILYYKVGGHVYCVRTDDADVTDRLLASSRPFKVSGKPNRDLLFTLTIDNDWQPTVPQDNKVGDFNCGGSIFNVWMLDDGSHQIVINDYGGEECCTMQANADCSQIKVRLRGNGNQLRYGLNNALMLSYAYAAADKKTALIHSSVVRCEGKGYMCLGKSGTGKSTHTALWLKHIEGTDLMNDDNPVIGINEQGVATVYGSPWSGKTPCYRNVEAPIGGFLKLVQAPYNKITKLDVLKSFVVLLPSCSLMKWDARCYRGVSDTISEILKQVATYQLECLPDEAACRLSHDTFFEG